MSRRIIKQLQAGYVGSNPLVTDPTGEIGNQNKRPYSQDFTDGAVAGTGVAASPGATVQCAGTVRRVTFAGPIAITANDTNFATITVSKSIAGATAVVLATRTTAITAGSGNITALAPVVLTLSAVAGALDLLVDDVLIVTVTKTGTGVALNAATSTCQVTTVVEEGVL